MAEKKVPISIVITAVDGVTSKVASMNRSLARLREPVDKVQNSFALLGNELGMSKLASSLGKVGSTGKTFFDELSNSALKLGAVTAAAAGSVFAVVHGFSSAGDDVAMMAARLGMTTDEYQKFAYAAKLANVDQETFNGSMTKFNRAIAEAAMGTGPGAEGFTALGISVRGQNGHLKTASELLPEVADKMSLIHNQSIKNAVATRLFSKEGAKLNDMFTDGAKGLKKSMDEASRVMAVISPDDIKKAQAFDEGVKSLGSTLLGVRNIVGAALAPAILKLGREFQEFIISNKAGIEAFAAKIAEEIPGALQKATEFGRAMYAAFTPVISAISTLADMFGGANLALGALVLYIAGPALVAMVNLGLAIGGLSKDILLMGVRIGALAFAPAVAAIGNFITAIRAGYGVMTAFNLVMAANPVGLVVVGIAALSTAIVALYKYWKPFSDLVDGTWAAMKGVFGASVPNPGDTNFVGPLPPTASGLPFGSAQTMAFANKVANQGGNSVVSVNFENLPKGTRVETESKDGYVPVDLNLGYSHAGLGNN